MRSHFEIPRGHLSFGDAVQLTTYAFSLLPVIVISEENHLKHQMSPFI